MLPACKNVICPVDSGGYGLHTLPEPSSRLFDSGLLLMPIKVLLTTKNIATATTQRTAHRLHVAQHSCFLLPFLPLCLLERCGLCQLIVHCGLACDRVELLELLLSVSISLFVGGAGGYAS